ncbi:DUF2884 family protein [Psychrobium sp. nBUS_13]|jgi:hypothetical protein|uniref:DUF2884 family protein n=1 Tax=Psychrobium sp. nBUS_13 TaxID=3395319 RepID=UPI003EC087CC
MKTKIALALTALLSTSAFAHDSHGRHNSCDININQSIKVTPAYVQILDGDKSLYRITDDSRLYAQGKRIHLNSEQQAIVDEYRDLMQELAPQVAHLVTQGLDMAKAAVEQVFTELFGDETQLQDKVQTIVAKFEDRITPLMDEEAGEYYLPKDKVANGGEDLGREIEAEVETLMKESAGHMMVLIGKMMLNGEGGMADFEQKMEAFGESMEARGEALEKSAEAMCGQMKKLDALETKMQKEIPEIAAFDLLKSQSI